MCQLIAVSEGGYNVGHFLNVQKKKKQSGVLRSAVKRKCLHSVMNGLIAGGGLGGYLHIGPCYFIKHRVVFRVI